MGRSLGYHDTDEDFDRPDLNMCPDCRTYFAQNNCPICGKPCPENMKAGNRPAVKKKKTKHRRGDTGRVVFVNWFHRWWFILLMLAVFPLVGIILLFTSPHETWKKVLVVSICALYVVGIYGTTIYQIIRSNDPDYNNPANLKLSEIEYKAECSTPDIETLYRSADIGKYVSATLVISERITNGTAEYYPLYYLAYDEDNTELVFILRDCRKQGNNLLRGDVITVWGETAGNTVAVVYGEEYREVSGPCINMAYSEQK